MAKNILVATPQPAFGELLRLSLEESGRYRVRLVQTGREALSGAEHILFSLAILDTTLDEPPFLYVAQGLRKQQPGIRLLLIPSHEGETAPNVVAAQPDGFIYQPFYAPSLLETIHALVAQGSPPEAAESENLPPTPPVPPPGRLRFPPAPDSLAGARGAGAGKTASAPAVKPTGTVQPVLQDAALVTQHLEEFLKDSSAPGVILLRMRQPWAAAGKLNQEALNEVASLLTRYTAANEGVDLARYVHLQSDGSEYLIYATPLVDSQVLAMVYQISTPLTVIRAQAGRLARLLRQSASVRLPAPASVSPGAAAPAEIVAPRAAPPDAAALIEDTETPDAVLVVEAMRLADLLAELPEPDPHRPASPAPNDWFKGDPAASAQDSGFVFPWERSEKSATLPQPLRAQAAKPGEARPTAPARMETPPSTASEAGAGLPAGVPTAETAPAAAAPQASAGPAEPPAPPAAANDETTVAAVTMPQAPPQQPLPVAEPTMPAEALPQTQPLPPTPTSEVSAAAALPQTRPLQPAASIAETTPYVPQPVYATQPQKIAQAPGATSPTPVGASPAQTAALPAAPAAYTAMPAPSGAEPSAIEQTRPVLPRAQSAYQPAEPMMPTFANLAYTCLLLPRLPSHALAGLLGQRLGEWLPQLCMAYNWRLEGLLVQPEYLQWTVQVAPSISPGNVVRLIRQQTSRRVFIQFPQLEVENPSGDFWASGYLIISGSQMPSPHLVQDFIRQTRQRQGSLYA